MASTLPLRPHPSPLLPGLQRPPLKSAFLPMPFGVRWNPNPSFSPRFRIISAAADSGASWEKEEARWLREEQRWLREERRWLREESRWNAERESLLREVAALRLRVESLEREALLRAASDPRPVLVQKTEVKETVLEEVRVPESAPEKDDVVEEVKKKIRWKTLRKGSEGEDVRVMQEALQKLGFYSGEEDKEYSSFSSGTERAVKTWQASLGTTEDGIMTAELLERLFSEQRMEGSNLKDGANGSAVASAMEIAEIQQTVVKESGDAEVEVSQRRVFLLGENRWEEPSRLLDGNKPISRTKAVSTTKCLACRGQGRLMCTECDGSGEPNIEPQFLEWIDEGAKCPYCEGLGYIICDVCEGKTIVDA